MCEYWVVGEPERSVEAWTVMHSTSIFLMDGEGRYLTHIPSEAAPADIAAGIKPYL